MATKLKDLTVTSVDLCDQGANPDAHIRLFKRNGEEADPDLGLFQKFARWFKKGYADATGEDQTGEVEKDAHTFGENFTKEQMQYITQEMFDCAYALSDSFASILCDDDLITEAKQSTMEKSLDEFIETVKAAIPKWSAGKRMETTTDTAGIQKTGDRQQALDKLLKSHDLGGEVTETNSNKKEETDTMKIDKSKMTPEERAALEALEKKYGVAKSEDGGEAAGTDGANETETIDTTPAPAKNNEAPAAEQAQTQNTEVHPEVAKAMADLQALTKRQNAEVEELKKSLEIERLTSVAKKYEVLGKKPEELAKKLYDMKKAGAYDDYIAVLDESLNTVEKSGLFSEIGSNNQGSTGPEAAIGMKAAELAKSATGGMASPDAIIKAWEENPELASEYEKNYRR